MSPSMKFYALISTLTVLIMYGILRLVASVTAAYPVFSGIGALASSFVVYRILCAFLDFLIRKSIFIRAVILGPSFMHGTWVGYFIGHAGDKRYVVEKFEQRMDRLIISGRSFTEDGNAHAQWYSETTTIDAIRGALTYTYSCDILSRNVTVQGVGVFQFERSSEDDAPIGLAGYVADLTDGHRMSIKEVKIEKNLLEWDSALEEAKNRFRTA